MFMTIRETYTAKLKIQLDELNLKMTELEDKVKEIRFGAHVESNFY